MTYISPFLSNINISNIPSFHAGKAETTFSKNIQQDSFSTNPLTSDLANRAVIENLAKSSCGVMNILKENKIPLNVNLKELQNLQQGHLKDTRLIAAKIYSALPKELKAEINLPVLQEAAMMHDYGKVLIPDKILTKKGKLNQDEKKIMELHSELGYELLKQKGLNPEVLNLVKYHHQTIQGNGYPRITDNFEPDISLQILNVADKYSALREARSYKEPMSKEEALQIIEEDVKQGLICEDVYDALKKSV